MSNGYFCSKSIDRTCWTEIILWKLCKNSMFVNNFQCYDGLLSNQWMRAPFNWEWLVGNSFKTITSFAFFHKLTFSTQQVRSSYWQCHMVIFAPIPSYYKYLFGDFRTIVTIYICFHNEIIVPLLRSMWSTCTHYTILQSLCGSNNSCFFTQLFYIQTKQTNKRRLKSLHNDVLVMTLTTTSPP